MARVWAVDERPCGVVSRDMFLYISNIITAAPQLKMAGALFPGQLIRLAPKSPWAT